jgi:hypothetical protein
MLLFLIERRGERDLSHHADGDGENGNAPLDRPRSRLHADARLALADGMDRRLQADLSGNIVGDGACQRTGAVSEDVLQIGVEGISAAMVGNQL